MEWRRLSVTLRTSSTRSIVRSLSGREAVSWPRATLSSSTPSRNSSRRPQRHRCPLLAVLSSLSSPRCPLLAAFSSLPSPRCLLLAAFSLLPSPTCTDNQKQWIWEGIACILLTPFSVSPDYLQKEPGRCSGGKTTSPSCCLFELMGKWLGYQAS